MYSSVRLLLLSLVTVGCADSASTADRTIVWLDSSGVGVASLPASVLNAPVDPAPSVRVDTVLSPGAEEPAFGFVSRVAVSPAGWWAVVDSLARSVWIGEGSGAPDGGSLSWRRTVLPGDGPVEIGYPGGIRWTGSDGDQLSVYDGARNRVVLVDAAGNLGSAALPDLDSGPRHEAPGGGAIRFVSQEEFADPSWPEGIHRVPLRLLAVRDSSTGLIWAGKGRAWSRGPRMMFGPTLFGSDTRFWASGDRVAVADAGSGTVQLYDAAGELRHQLFIEGSGPVDVRSLDDPLVAAMVASGLPGSDLPERAIREMINVLPRPDSVPPFSGLILGGDRVWLTGFRGSAAPGLRVPGFDPAWLGIPLGGSGPVVRLRFPPGVTPVDLLGDSLFVVRLEDDLGRHGLGLARMPGG